MRVRALLRLEIKAVLASRAAIASMTAFLVAGLVAIGFGRSLLEQQRRVLDSAAAIDAAEEPYLRKLHGEQPAGHLAYYLFRTARHEPSPWAAVATGQRDASAYALRIRLLGLEGQLYDAEPGNPSARLAGSFDLSFLISLLAPLVLIVLAYNVLAEDEERGIVGLLRAQGSSLRLLLGLRVGLRTAMVLALSLLLLGVAALIVGLPPDRRLLDAVLVVASYVLCWGGIIALVVVSIRGSTATSLVLVGVWLATAVVGPAAANVALEAALPVPQGLELTLRQRLEVHDGWDRPRGAALEAFRRHRPEWAGHAVPADRFSWAWYYANWEAGDRSVEPLARQYRDNLLARHRWTAAISALMPPARAGLLLDGIAQTDLPSRVGFLDSVRQFHEGLKRSFYPLIFADAKMQAADYDRLPRHRFAPAWTGLPGSALTPFLLTAAMSAAAAAVRLRRRLRAN